MNPTPHLSDTDQVTTSSYQGGSSVLQVSVSSRTGIRHRVNQDHVSFRSPDAFVVADGVGGGAWAEVASEMLSKGLSSLFRPDESSVNALITQLDVDIATQLKALGDGAGASVVACLWQLDGTEQAYLASWVGDCQLSHWKKSSSWQLSWQSQEQSYEALGLQPPEGVSAQSPANMVGCGMVLPVSHHRLTFQPQERIVLSSDGFWRAVSPELLGQFMNQYPAQLPTNAAEQLCDMALRAGSEDDISVLVIENIRPNVFSPRVFKRWLVLVTLAVCFFAALGWLWLPGLQ